MAAETGIPAVKTLDRYILRTYVVSLGGAIVVFSISTVVLDFFGRLGRFAHNDTVGTTAEGMSRLEIFVVFYLSYLPFLLKLLIPFIALGSAAFVVAAHLKANEVVAAKAAGISARRLWLPVLLGGLALSAGLLLFQEFVVPSLNREHHNVRRLFEGTKADVVRRLPHFRDGHGSVMVAGAYRFSDRKLFNVVVLWPWKEDGFEAWIAPELHASGNSWVAPRGVRVSPQAPGGRPAGAEQPIRDLPAGTEVPFSVGTFEIEALVAKRGTAELSIGQLDHLRRKFPDRRSLQVAYHKEISHPFSAFALTLVGVGFFLAVRGSFYAKALVVLLLGGVYFFFEIFCTSLGARGDLPPVLAAYLPLSVYLSLGVARWWTLPT